MVHIVAVVGISGERSHLEDLGEDEKIILKLTSRYGMRRHGLDCSASGQGQVKGICV